MGDFVFVVLMMGVELMLLVREDEGWVGFSFGEKRGRKEKRNSICILWFSLYTLLKRRGVNMGCV